MKHLKLTGLITFILIFIVGCKKDWGDTKGDIYTPLEGPPEDVKYDPNNYEITYDINPSPVRMGREAIVSVQISRKDLRQIDFDIYYDWTIVNQADYYLQARVIDLELYFHPRINNELNVDGFGISSVTVSSSVTDALNWLGSAELVRDAVNVISMLFINLNIGYENNNGNIEYFLTKQIGVPVYY